MAYQSVSACYSEVVMSNRVLMGVLTRVGTIKSYNIYKLMPGNIPVVVFSDQPKLLAFVEATLGKVVGVTLLKPTNNKFRYVVELSGQPTEVFTAAKVGLLQPQKGSDNMKVSLTSSGLLYLE